jgi:hypothetical protein
LSPCFDVNQGTLFDLILAANYLDIKDLLDITYQKVADTKRLVLPKLQKEHVTMQVCMLL